MYESDKILKEEEPIDNMLWCIMYVLFFHSMLLLLFSSLSSNSNLNLCKIWQSPYVRFYLYTLTAAIVIMLLYALCHVMAQAVHMWKYKDSHDRKQWKDDLYFSPKLVGLYMSFVSSRSRGSGLKINEALFQTILTSSPLPGFERLTFYSKFSLT